MSEEQLAAFLEAVKEDSGLQEKLNAAADVDAVVEIAKEAGFMISADELEMSKELADYQLGCEQPCSQCGGAQDTAGCVGRPIKGYGVCVRVRGCVVERAYNS
jgi:predicted ribosomally synthesized peptide with nif11-like leader